MRVFVTGATGFIGSRIVSELIDAGHRVLGMTRLDRGARQLENAGAEVHRGTLEDVVSIAERRRPGGRGDRHLLRPRLLSLRRELREGSASIARLGDTGRLASPGRFWALVALAGGHHVLCCASLLRNKWRPFAPPRVLQTLGLARHHHYYERLRLLSWSERPSPL